MASYKFIWSPLLLLFVTSISSSFFPNPCLGDNQPKHLVPCLTRHNISNFTTYSDPNYNNLLYFSIQNLRYTGPLVPKPTVIIVPSSKEQLAYSVLCCRKESIEIRVRCGGHSYEGMSSVVTDGNPFIIIDMMNLDRISIDLQDEVAWVEGGATLGQIYHAIARSSKVHGFPAGMCPTVGVGGHISGGGYNLMSRKYGLAADHVVDALLIDAEGRVMDRQAMGEDVFWAIRGGGGGVWGIIYAYKIQLVNIPTVVTGFVISRFGMKAHVANLVHKWQFAAPSLEDGFYLFAHVGASSSEAVGDNVSVTFKGFYLGSKENAVLILERVFPELGVTIKDCEEMSWIESIVYFSGLEKGSSVFDLDNRHTKDKAYFKAKFDYVRTHVPLEGIEAAIAILEKQPKGFVFLEPCGGIMETIPSDSIAFPHRKGNIFTIQYLVNWDGEDNGKSKDYIEWIRGLYDLMTPYVSSNPRASYVNYMDLDLGSSNGDDMKIARVWGEKYFLENYDRLVRAKTLIDPNNIFKNQQGIPPMSTSMVSNKPLVSEMR